VSFFVDKSTREGGRRNVKHEFPLMDKPFVDDLGRAYRSWKIEGYVIGPDYDQQRDALIAALEDDGTPGTLIHPYYGEQIVACDGRFTVTETKGEGGWAQFSMTFCETDQDPPAPLAVFALPNLLAGLLAAIALVIAAAASLALGLAITFLAIRALVRMVTAFAESVADLVELLSGDDAALFKRDMERLIIDIEILVEDPEELLTRFGAAIDRLANADPIAAAEGLLAAYAAEEGLPPSRNADYFDAMTGAMRKLLLFKAIGFASSATYPSHARATAMRDRLSDLLDEQAASADEEVYAAFVQVRADLVRSLPPQGAQLPEVVHYTPPVTVSSLLLAYQLYGSVDREADVVARNEIANPCMIRGGLDLEVLSGG
jgi:prophage DNA circulation protein